MKSETPKKTEVQSQAPSAFPGMPLMRGYIIDMDGVLYRGSELISGAREFVKNLEKGGYRYLFLTNNSEKTPAELRRKVARMGINVAEDHFYTSSMATAQFLNAQKPKGRAFVLGGTGLREALLEVGYNITDRGPDYVVVGNPTDYTFDLLEKAIMLVRHGARLVGTNSDVTGPTAHGVSPACGALVAPIELSTGRRTYFIGKPNPLIMRLALRTLGVRSSQAFMVGDRMDTDIQAGLESGMKTILVLSGVTRRKDIPRYAYRPHFVFSHVGEIPVGGAAIKSKNIL